MNILVSGSTGFIGSALVAFLTQKGHSVTRLVRREPKAGSREVRWDPAASAIDARALAGVDAVVHLAGEPVGPRRWTRRRKERIRDSRIGGTQLLSETLARLDPPPRVLASASGVGYYGTRGDQTLREDSGPGTDFLAEVAVRWEAATAPAAQHGSRVVNLRFGNVLSPAGGVLANVLPLFKSSLGGRLGTGEHWMSWISLDDVVRAIYHTLDEDALGGPVNIAAPGAVTNIEFTKTLGRVLSRPTLLPVPAALLRIVFGGLADVLLASARMDPAKLLASGFRFQYPELEGALRAMLGRRDQCYDRRPRGGPAE